MRILDLTQPIDRSPSIGRVIFGMNTGLVEKRIKVGLECCLSKQRIDDSNFDDDDIFLLDDKFVTRRALLKHCAVALKYDQLYAPMHWNNLVISDEDILL